MANVANLTSEYAARAVHVKTGKTLYALATCNPKTQDETISLVFQTSTEPIKSSYNLWKHDTFSVVQIEPEANPKTFNIKSAYAQSHEEASLVKRGLFNVHLRNLDAPACPLLLGIKNLATSYFPNLNPAESAILVHTDLKHMIWHNAFTFVDDGKQDIKIVLL